MWWTSTLIVHLLWVDVESSHSSVGQPPQCGIAVRLAAQ